MASKQSDLLPEERFPLPESLGVLFQKKELNEKHLWVLGTLTRHITRQDEEAIDFDPHLFKPLYSRILKDVITSKYPDVIGHLKVKGFIEVELNAQNLETYDNVRGVSKKYRLSGELRDEALQDKLITLPIRKQTLLRKIQRSLVEAQERVFDEHPWAREELRALEYLRFDEKGSRAWLREISKSGELNGKKVTNKQFINLEDNIHCIKKLLLNDKILARISVKHGRLFYILTYCKRELRQFITNPEGKSLVELDMKSAQWMLIAYCMALATKHRYTDNLKKLLLGHIGEELDVLRTLSKYSTGRAFASAVIFQDIYTELALLSKSKDYHILSGNKVEGEERDKLKKQLLRHILYGFQTSKMKNAFKDLPPTEKSFLEVFYETYTDVIVFCKSIADDCRNRKPSGQISRSGCLSELLSAMEGDFFHQKVRKALKSYFLNSLGYFIVHDGVYVDPSAKDATLDLLEGLCKKQFGVSGLFNL
jgi:hypothetical protein